MIGRSLQAPAPASIRPADSSGVISKPPPSTEEQSWIDSIAADPWTNSPESATRSFRPGRPIGVAPPRAHRRRVSYATGGRRNVNATHVPAGPFGLVEATTVARKQRRRGLPARTLGEFGILPEPSPPSPSYPHYRAM